MMAFTAETALPTAAPQAVFESTRVQTLSHTELLNGESHNLWEACKHAVALLPDLAPEYFARAEFEKGWGGPGSIGVFHFGPAIPGAGSVKHRIDLVDDESKTLAYTVLGGDPSYSSFAAEMKFSPADDNTTEVIWTAKYEPVGEAGPPEHIKKNVIVTLKTFEKAVMENRVVRHTQTLNAPADTIWNILMHEDVILPKVIPHIIASYEFLEGNGEPGSIRLLKLGHAIPNGNHVVERIDVNEAATKRWGYTVLQGDPKYKYLSAVMQFLPGAEEGTTLAKWVGIYVPHNQNIPPPDLALNVWKVFEGVARASPQAVY
ncbi:uncharacterized protein [Physcomitrium patens]|uniref:Bet v I/Major latex protein domain-containing protein n=1 Tax=Physcomitrium patens TaxID=3218 RepID=A0A2K1L7Q4_PHYPA|nr:uncharacterized protein LOC112278964 [Physcomitrium patens]PNR62057.1 hypothetical protein PHYPA_000481 [Physcomitrium patens]|eukprot:XP_024368704.1 uncharacterized protein LOC112278964 [Physcomitrella patens]